MKICKEVRRMRKYRYLFYSFAALAVLLSDAMCAAVAYCYCQLQWGGRCAGFSAPPSVALLLAVPYAAGIAICAGLAWFFRKKHRRSL